QPAPLSRPRDPVASTEGERYPQPTPPPPPPRLPAAPSVPLFQPPEPRVGRGLSPPSARPPLCVVDAGQCAPRPQKFCRADARGPSGRPLSGPDTDYACGY